MEGAPAASTPADGAVSGAGSSIVMRVPRPGADSTRTVPLSCAPARGSEEAEARRGAAVVLSSARIRRIVLDCDQHGVGEPLEIDAARGRLRVADDVRQRLLDDR